MTNKVTYAKLHAGIFIPGVGALKDTLPPDGKTLENFVMVKQGDGNLRLSWTNKARALRETAEVGASNIIVLVFEGEKIANQDA